MSTLAVARKDALNGTESSAFNAMFKQDDVASTVALLLGHMWTMEGVKGLRPAPGTSLRPHFACVGADASKKYANLDLPYDPWDQCHANLVMPSFYAAGTAYIFLCSSFFRLAPRPSKSSCPIVRGNLFKGDQETFHENFQVYSLTYDLTRFYLGRNALDASSTPPEVFDWNKCVFDLNEVESVVNPTNIELYVARKFLDNQAATNVTAKIVILNHHDTL